MNETSVNSRLLWCDAEANAGRLSTLEGVRDVVLKANHAKIDTLIVDVKPLIGEVLYMSDLAPRLGDIDGVRFPESFDLLDAMIREGHANGISIHAAINVFSEGNRQLNRGPAFDHREWQSTMYEVSRTVTISGVLVKVDDVDPWVLSDVPTLYTRKFGMTLSTVDGKLYIVIREHTVESVVHVCGAELCIPENGCVLVLSSTGSNLDVKEGDLVEFKSEPVFRLAQDSKVPSWGLFVNPTGPARAYELQIISELALKYDIDGITFDRMRYANLSADFGASSRAAFEKYLGQVVRWPGDIFTIDDAPWRPPTSGKYYREWLEWRAWQIHDFAKDAVNLVRGIRPEAKVGVYVGSWYDSYYDVGVNWGSSAFHPGYSWMTPAYNSTGYAEFFDYICTGCYYANVTCDDARLKGVSAGATVEAACDLSNTAVCDASPVFGSLYLRDYEGNAGKFQNAVEMVLRKTAGVMLFDLVYLEEYGWWPALAETLEKS